MSDTGITLDGYCQTESRRVEWLSEITRGTWVFPQHWHAFGRLMAVCKVDQLDKEVPVIFRVSMTCGVLSVGDTRRLVSRHLQDG
jgi:hypothetical protein